MNDYTSEINFAYRIAADVDEFVDYVCEFYRFDDEGWTSWPEDAGPLPMASEVREATALIIEHYDLVDSHHPLGPVANRARGAYDLSSHCREVVRDVILQRRGYQGRTWPEDPAQKSESLLEWGDLVKAMLGEGLPPPTKVWGEIIVAKVTEPASRPAAVGNSTNATFPEVLEDLRESYRVTDVGNGNYLLLDGRFTAWSRGVSGYIEDEYGSACLDRFEIRTEPKLVNDHRTVPAEFMREDGPVIIRERTPEQVVAYKDDQRRKRQAAEAAWAAINARQELRGAR